MRDLLDPKLKPFRRTDPDALEYMKRCGVLNNGRNGIFQVPTTAGELLRIIATIGDGWDHVSVSLPDRCPTWQDMETVKRLFFYDNETAMELHVAVEKHISTHPYCLHIWRPTKLKIPLPPSYMV